MTPIGHGQPSSGLRDCVTITASCTDYLRTRALVPCLVLYESALELVWGPPYVHYLLPVRFPALWTHVQRRRHLWLIGDALQCV